MAAAAVAVGATVGVSSGTTGDVITGKWAILSPLVRPPLTAAQVDVKARLVQALRDSQGDDAVRDDGFIMRNLYAHAFDLDKALSNATVSRILRVMAPP